MVRRTSTSAHSFGRKKYGTATKRPRRRRKHGKTPIDVTHVNVLEAEDDPFGVCGWRAPRATRGCVVVPVDSRDALGPSVKGQPRREEARDELGLHLRVEPKR